ncbi:MAG: hypothetical protein PHR69_06160 [Sphaerochaeta sp.]|nr:hypothetical protein [Sphaerochaeta sp.]
MHITIPKKELAEAIRPIAKIASTRPTLPFIQYVRLKAQVGTKTAVLYAQDLDQFLEYYLHLAAPVDADIDIAVACSELKNLIKGVGDLAFEISANTVKVQDNGGPCIDLPLYPIAEMPDSPVIPKDAVPVLLPTSFATFLAHAALSTSSDPTRALLAGVNVSEIGVTATSGQDLYHVALPLNLLPKDIVINYTSALANLKQRWVSLATWIQGDERQLFAIRGEGFTYIASGVNGTYPNWQQVVPDDDSFDLVVSWSEQNAAVLQRFLSGVDSKLSEYVELVASQELIKVCDASGRCVTFAAVTHGGNLPCKTSVKTSFLLKMIAIGHRTLRINTRDDSPLKAEGGPGFYVFMPARREDNQNHANVVNEDKSQNASQSHEPIEEAKSTQAQREEGGQKITKNESCDVSPTTEKIHDPQQHDKEKPAMQESNNVTRFTVPANTDTSSTNTEEDTLPIEEASQCIDFIREQVKNLDERLTQASRKLKEAMLVQRRKKRQYADAVKKLERIRQASGF